MSVAGLVLGIIAVVIPLVAPSIGWIGLIVGVVGIILSVLGKKKANEEGTKSGMATAGLVLSIIGTVLAGIFWIACMLCVKAGQEALNQLNANDLLNQLNQLNSGN